jgi:hypothetical protein
MYVASLEIRKSPPDRGYSKKIRAHLDKVSESVDNAAAQQARINLLFGYDSPAGEAANSGHRNSFVHYMQFNEVALEAIERSVPSWHRYRAAAGGERRPPSSLKLFELRLPKCRRRTEGKQSTEEP